MSLEKAVLIFEIVLLSLFVFITLYHFIEIIRRDIQIRKTAVIINKAANKFIIDIIDIIDIKEIIGIIGIIDIIDIKIIDDIAIECIKDNDNMDIANNQTMQETNSCQENNNYNDMNFIKLRKIAQKRKIKGYYNLHKDELIKALKETETLQK